MKKTAIRAIAGMLCIWILSVSTYAAEYLVPVGALIGMELRDDTVCVASFDETLGEKAKAAGLCEGDRILTMNGNPITSAEDIREALHHSKGLVTMTVERKGKQITLRINPQITAEGPKLGIYLKQGVSGIGTVTFYDPETGNFGALGHGVNQAGGELLEMVSGKIYEAGVVSVKPGKSGEPGQLRGAVTDSKELGQLFQNTPRGVFGQVQRPWTGELLSVAEYEDVREGPAVIRSTVCGDGVQEYSVEILKIYPKSKTDGRNLMLRITDKALLETTGGIVQGMSGSPILQDGRIVGAVTHVLVNDPTTGYGIFIENMLN